MTAHETSVTATETGALSQLLATAVQQFETVGCDTPSLDAEVLLAHVLGKERTWLYLHPHAHVNREQHQQFLSLVARRRQREPVAYLVGHKAFFGLEFSVTPDTLVPRPETELLVEIAIEMASHLSQTEAKFDRRSIDPKNSKLLIADVGTGSGCIAVALAKHLDQAHILAIDVSEQALEVAQKNAEQHQVSDRITFLTGDLLTPLTDAVDIIVSNPPYVSLPELSAPFTSPEVHRYEPRLALDGGRDGLDVVRRLLPQAKNRLKSNGRLLVEIGATQGEAATNLALAQFPQATIEVKPDLAGLDRLLVVTTC